MKTATLKDFTKPRKPWEIEGVEWREVKLGDKKYFHIETGSTPKTSVKEYWENGIIKWATPKDLGKNNGMFIYDTERKITELGLNSCSTTVIPKGSIIISTRAPIGHIAILGDDMCFNQGCKGLIIKDNDIASEFVYYVLLTKIDLMKTLGSGPTFEELSKDKLASIEIPLPFRNGKPDLETQKKIVEYIEANFSRIDKILEKKKKELKQLDGLWESVLEQAFKPRKGEEWKEVRFLDKINIVKGTKPKSSVKEEKEATLPYLTMEYFREKIIKEYIPIEENKITLVNEGDLVIIADGSRSGELFFCDTKGVLVSTMAKFEIDESEINKKYIFWFLTTHFEHLNKSKYTATPHVNKNYLKNLKILLPFRNGKPDLEKQKEIANYLDRVYEKIKVLKERIQNQINQLEEMKESILDEVFNHDKETNN